MTYLGSGICSYRRFTAGAILSVTVPETTIRSAWRGPGAKGMTPRRMKSWRGIDAGQKSMGQQAGPEFKTPKEEPRPPLRVNLPRPGAAGGEGAGPVRAPGG